MLNSTCSVLLHLAFLPAALAQDNEAEKLFRDMEKKIKAADAVQITVDIELRAAKGNEDDPKRKNKVSKASGFLLMVYNLGPAGQVTLWIDADTLLPLKRVTVTEVARGTEMCIFNLRPKIEAGTFVVP